MTRLKKSKKVENSASAMEQKIETSFELVEAKNPRLATSILVLAHGAGAGMDHVFITKMAQLIAEHNIHVILFNFPYMDKRKVDGKRRPPDGMPKLLTCYHNLIEKQAVPYAKERKLNLYLGGKSMGSRVAATLLSGDNEAEILKAELLEKIKGVLCIGYPFHPQKKPEKLRLCPLQSNSKPVLVLQGTRDALGAKVEIEAYALSDDVTLSYFEDGDHDLKPRVKSGFTHKQHMENAAIAIKDFIDETTNS